MTNRQLLILLGIGVAISLYYGIKLIAIMLR